MRRAFLGSSNGERESVSTDRCCASINSIWRDSERVVCKLNAARARSANGLDETLARFVERSRVNWFILSRLPTIRLIKKMRTQWKNVLL